MSIQTGAITRSRATRSELRARDATAKHHATLVAAEVRRLQRRLRAYGPMPRASLAEMCGATRWREGTFEHAVKQGIRSGKLAPLALGWLKNTDR